MRMRSRAAPWAFFRFMLLTNDILIALVATATTSFLAFLTTLVGFVYTWSKDARQRRWDIEDRRILASKVEATTAAVATTSETLHAKVDGVGEQAVAAYTEANTVNLKIQQMHEEIAAVLQVIRAQQAEVKANASGQDRRAD